MGTKKVGKIAKKVQKRRLKWYWHVMRREKERERERGTLRRRKRTFNMVGQIRQGEDDINDN